jgi:two-component system OmpR family sensor kinase
MGKMRSLLDKSLTRFILCTAVVLLVCTPLFYLLTKHFYAEDMIELMENYSNGGPLPENDLKQDIMAGVMIQYALVIAVLSIASVIMMRWVSKSLWHPFEDTLDKAAKFDIEKPEIPSFMDTDVKEFKQLDESLTNLMKRSSDRYRLQKEFTENASHELQTPIAVLQGKLDVLLQDDLSESQFGIVQELYDVSNRMSRLNRNLLLLAKIDNSQYERKERIDLMDLAQKDAAQLSDLYGSGRIVNVSGGGCTATANPDLMDILVNNLLVNAFRHGSRMGEVAFVCDEGGFSVKNTAQGKALDPTHIFDRFNNTSDPSRGTGIGLAIVKAICDYQGWTVAYSFENGMHVFTVRFAPKFQQNHPIALQS